ISIKVPESIFGNFQVVGTDQNFYKNGSNIDKCRWNAFDAAMDLHWLTGANFSEDIGATIDLNGTKFNIEHWVGTTDHKLHSIAASKAFQRHLSILLPF
ncbi:hypothetical protein ACUODJ_51595, partial [Escherichia sp. HC-CC]